MGYRREAHTNQQVLLHIPRQVHNKNQSWIAKKHDIYTSVHPSHCIKINFFAFRVERNEMMTVNQIASIILTSPKPWLEFEHKNQPFVPL